MASDFFICLSRVLLVLLDLLVPVETLVLM